MNSRNPHTPLLFQLCIPIAETFVFIWFGVWTTPTSSRGLLLVGLEDHYEVLEIEGKFLAPFILRENFPEIKTKLKMIWLYVIEEP